MRGKGSIANKGSLVDKLSGRCIMALMTICIHSALLTHNVYKPDKVQNGVGPISLLVSASIKCFEEQYSEVLSVYVISTNTAEEFGQMESLFTKKSLSH